MEVWRRVFDEGGRGVFGGGVGGVWRGRGAVVLNVHLDLVAVDAALGVDVVGGQVESLADGVTVERRLAGQRSRIPDLFRALEGHGLIARRLAATGGDDHSRGHDQAQPE